MCSQLRINLFKILMSSQVGLSDSVNCITLNSFISAMMRLEADTGNLEQKHRSLKTSCEQIGRDIARLQQQNKQLGQVEEMLTDFLQQNALSSEQCGSRVEEPVFVAHLGKQQNPTSGSVHLTLPKLESACSYFEQLAQESLVDAYIEAQNSAEVQQQKHAQQARKLEDKLKSLDEEVAEVLDKLRNTRRLT